MHRRIFQEFAQPPECLIDLEWGPVDSQRDHILGKFGMQPELKRHLAQVFARMVSQPWFFRGRP